MRLLPFLVVPMSFWVGEPRAFGAHTPDEGITWREHLPPEAVCRHLAEVIEAGCYEKRAALEIFRHMVSAQRELASERSRARRAARGCAAKTRELMLRAARTWWTEGGRDHWSSYLGMRLAVALYELYLTTFPRTPEAPVVALERARLMCALTVRGIQRSRVEELVLAFAAVAERARGSGLHPDLGGRLVQQSIDESARCQQVLRERRTSGD